MVINKLMWSTTFSIFSHPDGILDVGVDMLSDIVEIKATTLEFVAGIAYAVDVLTTVIFNVVPCC